MPVAIRHRFITVPPGNGSEDSPRRFPPDLDDAPTVSFNTKVGDFGVALRAFNFEWVANDDDHEPDHHIRDIQVRPQIIRVNDFAVKYWVECQYADRNYDDRYKGFVELTIMADVA
jgi:hypothetical protein